MKRTQFLLDPLLLAFPLLAFPLLAIGCGNSGDSASADSHHADDDGAVALHSPAADSASSADVTTAGGFCLQLAGAVCEQAFVCSPETAASRYGTVARCKNAAVCGVGSSQPCPHGYNPQWGATCVTQSKALTCSDFLGGIIPASCQTACPAAQASPEGGAVDSGGADQASARDGTNSTDGPDASAPPALDAGPCFDSSPAADVHDPFDTSANPETSSILDAPPDQIPDASETSDEGSEPDVVIGADGVDSTSDAGLDAG